MASTIITDATGKQIVDALGKIADRQAAFSGAVKRANAAADSATAAAVKANSLIDTSDAAKLRAATDALASELGVYSGSFKIVSGTSHSSTADRLAVSIPAGTRFGIVMAVSQAGTKTVQVYLVKDDGTSERYGGNYYVGVGGRAVDVVADYDVAAIGFYVAAPTADDVFSFRVNVDGGMAYRLAIAAPQAEFAAQSVADVSMRPLMRDGSPGNTGNPNFIATVERLANRGAMVLSADVDLPDGYEYMWIWKGIRQDGTAGMDYTVPSTEKYTTVETRTDIYSEVIVGLALQSVADGSYMPLRIGEVGNRCVTVSYVAMASDLAAMSAKTFVSSDYNASDGFDGDCARYAASFVDSNVDESFLFFTDPHVFQHSVDESRMKRAVGTIEYAYNTTPTDFVLCGGDWLQSQDTAAEAAYKMARIDGAMRAKFGDRYYPMVGNHDTNMQGAGAGNYPNTSPDMLSVEAVERLWFREYGATYYDFRAPGGTRVYVFDTGSDWDYTMDEHRKAQCRWFAQRLAESEDAHSVIAMHILMGGGNVQPLADNVTRIAKAYNDRARIDVYGTAYDFAAAVGKVAFAIAGHTHQDSSGVANGIPYAITTTAGYGTAFDLCAIDYEAGKLRMTRVGDGSDREIGIIV